MLRPGSMLGEIYLTHKQMKMHRLVLSTMATDALVLKYQAISNNHTDKNVFCTELILRRIVTSVV